jgi:hypothetical protein
MPLNEELSQGAFAREALGGRQTGLDAGRFRERVIDEIA